MPGRKPVIALQNPTIERAAEFIEKTLSERKTMVVIGECSVDYQGRATSKLEAGERIVIIKEDGSVLIHRPTGYDPVNWQPPGCLFQIEVVDEVLKIRAVRLRPAESVRLTFNNIYMILVLNLLDKGEFSLFASEEDMQKAILREPSIVEPGLKLISYEKKVDPGFIDIYAIDRAGRLVVVEIKRRTAGRKAALQLAKYISHVGTPNREVRGILVAPRLAKGVQRVLTTLGLEFKSVDPKKCTEILRKANTRELAEFF